MIRIIANKISMKLGQLAEELSWVGLKSRPILWSILGDTGEGACEWLKFLIMNDVQLPHLKILFPTAPERPYTPLGGEVREYVT
jgi:hypothetical protein